MVQAHLDRLKATFFASFVLYAPMPYVLERCFYEVYEDRGWDLVENRCRRGADPFSFPTLTELHAKVAPIVRPTIMLFIETFSQSLYGRKKIQAPPILIQGCHSRSSNRNL